MGFLDVVSGVPALSWADDKPPLTIEYTLLPADAYTNPATGVNYPEGAAYQDTVQTDIDTGEIKRFDSKVAGQVGDPRQAAVLFIQTDLKDWAMTSPEFRERVKNDPDRKDDGVRKLFVQGKTAPKSLRVRLAQAKMTKGPEIGCVGSVTLTERKPIEGKPGQKENIFEFGPITPPSSASLKIVDEYKARKAEANGESTGGSLTPSGQGDEGPPF